MILSLALIALASPCPSLHPAALSSVQVFEAGVPHAQHVYLQVVLHALYELVLVVGVKVLAGKLVRSYDMKVGGSCLEGFYGGYG